MRIYRAQAIHGYLRLSSPSLYFRRPARHFSMSQTTLQEKRSAVFDGAKIDIVSRSYEADNKIARREVSRSFISDTITVPTAEMYEYALRASLGDDVYHDPSTIALEEHIAKLTGKEAALFVSSGTMSNQLALRTHLTQPPYSVICDKRSHINKYEAGGAAFHSGAHLVPVLPSNGHHITLSDIKPELVIGSDIHFAPTKVIALENTLNGTIIPQDEIIAISDFAHSEGIKMHLDGARIWHVAAETGLPLNELCAPFDSVSLCFSKGLGAPVGSCLVGPKDFISKARWFRKLFGGGMRQTGFLAGAAAYAVTHNFPKLPAVHELARKLEAGLAEIGCEITSSAETCMIFFDPSPLGFDYDALIERLSKLDEPIKLYGSRIVVHIQTTPEAVDDLLKVVRELAEERKAAGYVRPANNVNGKTNGNGSIYRDVYVRKKPEVNGTH